MGPGAHGNLRTTRRSRSRKFSIIACVLLAGCGSHSLHKQPSIEMTRTPASGQGGPDRMETIAGRVDGAQPGQQIVLYAKNDVWWIQPLWSRPFTNVEKDGTWKSFTHLGTDYAVLLVGPGFHPQPRISTLPTEGSGVVRVLAVKGTTTPPAPLKILHFSGYDWKVRSGSDRPRRRTECLRFRKCVGRSARPSSSSNGRKRWPLVMRGDQPYPKSRIWHVQVRRAG